jgi:hypothetical protein
MVVVRSSPLFAMISVCVSGFIRFTIRIILPSLVPVLVALAVLPAPLIIRVAVESAFVIVVISVAISILIVLTFLLVIPMVVLCYNLNQPTAAKRQNERQKPFPCIHSSSIRQQIVCL